MKQSLRHQKIVELVKQKGYLSTEELVALFGVSPQTIRRDLNELYPPSSRWRSLAFYGGK